MKKIYGLMALLVLGGCVADTDRGSTERTGEAAQAVSSIYVGASFNLIDFTTHITTTVMPKGWYTGKLNQPDWTKSPVTVYWSTPDTNCVKAESNSFSSLDPGGGTFTVDPDANSKGGYSWYGTHDLNSLAHHWYNSIGCDGSTTIVGCQKGRTIYYELSVGGSCLTAGGTCTAYGSVYLPAVQDPDVTATDCPVVCDQPLGPCVLACQTKCGNGNSDCSNCCECWCKHDLYGDDDPVCGPQPNCYDDNGNHGACMEKTLTRNPSSPNSSSLQSK
jgi:hypothetical protein